MERKYAQLPIEEAICEFRPAKDVKWDLTVPGQFPEKEQRLVQGFGEILVFYNKDRNILTQVGPGMVVLNVLKPYPGWEVFKQKIQFVLENLLDILPVSKLEYANLRYINIINLPSLEERLEEYLQFYPYLGSKLSQEKQLFTMSVEFSYEDDKDRCKLTLSNSDLPRSLMLDIEYFTYELNRLLAKDLLNWLEKAHEVIVNIFEGCITDELRVPSQLKLSIQTGLDF